MTVRPRGWVRAFFLAIALLAVPSADSEETGLWYEPKTLDLGKLRAGTTTEAKIRYGNKGTSTIEIRGLVPDCDCIDEESTMRGALLPGDSGIITLKVTVPRKAGPVSASLVVTDGQNREDHLVVQFTVTSSIQFAPAEITETLLLSNEPFLRSIRIQGPVEKITGITSIKGTKAEVDQTGKLLRITIPPTGAVGSFRDRIIVTLRDDAGLEEQTELFVELKVTAPVKVSPPSLALGAITPGQTIERDLVVTNIFPQGYRLAVKRVDKPEWIKDCKIEPKGDAVLCRVTVEPSESASALSGRIILVLDDGIETRVEIPVSAVLTGTPVIGASKDSNTKVAQEIR